MGTYNSFYKNWFFVISFQISYNSEPRKDVEVFISFLGTQYNNKDNNVTLNQISI